MKYPCFWGRYYEITVDDNGSPEIDGRISYPMLCQLRSSGDFRKLERRTDKLISYYLPFSSADIYVTPREYTEGTWIFTAA